MNKNNIKDVAKLAGVSPSTVSRVLSDNSYVSGETRKRVLSAVDALAYVPNPLAKSLKKGGTNMIALLIPSIQNHIYPEIVRGVEDVARKNGISVILCNTDDDPFSEKKYVNKLRTHWTDGFIVCSMGPDAEHIRSLAGEGVPLVLAARYYDNTIDAVAIDNKKAASEAVKYLILTGHKKIGIALGNCDLNIYKDRFLGYKQALSEAGHDLDDRFIMQNSTDDSKFYHLMQNMLSAGNIPDGIFATTDQKAIIIMRAILDKGLRIPQDISVIGFDNIPVSASINPSLSTVSQPLYKMGALAMEKLILQIEAKEEGKPYEPMVNLFGTELIVRDSTR